MLKKINFKSVQKSSFLIFSRVFLLYALCFFAVKLLTSEPMVELKTIHHLRPRSFSPLFENSKGSIVLSKEEIVKYVKFFKKVSKYTKFKYEPYSMLGYCYYFLGDISRSIKYYKKSLALNSRFFWSNYNLGLIYYEKKKYKKALKLFQKAVSVDIRKNVVFMNKSMVYFSFVNDSEKYMIMVKSGLKNGYANCFKLMALSLYYSGNLDEMVRISKEALLIGFADKDTFNFYIGLGLCGLGRYNEALLFFSEVLNDKVRDADLFYYSSLCFKEAGNEAMQRKFLKLSEVLRFSGGHTSFLSPDLSLEVF